MVVAAAFFAVQRDIIAQPTAVTSLTESVNRIRKATIATAMPPTATATPMSERVTVQVAAPTPEPTPISSTSNQLSQRSDFFKSTSDGSKVNREAQPQIDIEELESLAHRLINDERTKRGLHALEHDGALGRIARNHSLDMAQNDYFSHDNLKGQDPTDRGKSAGYDCIKDYGSHYTYGLAENIHHGWLASSTTYINGIPFHDWNTQEEIAFAAVQGWMSSKGHRENILTASYDRTGIGSAIAEDGKVYFTQVFC